jgi:deoxyribonuclease-4
LFPEIKTTVLLELMTGKGSEVGSTFEEIRQIIDCVELQEHLGVCLDTCHVFAAGYDIVNDLDGVLAHFDDVIGLNRLKAIHINDSMTPFASHKDRHECIGKGTLGLDCLVQVINHPLLRDKPFYLETPNELDGYAQEIALLRSKRK